MTDVMGTNAISYTPQIMANQMISNIDGAEAQQASWEEQLSTGNTINQPSDNPAGAAELMQLNANLSRAQQYAANANDGAGWLSLGNSTMNQVLSALHQAQQAVESVSGATLSTTPSALQALSDQVASARTQLINLANTTYGGQAIFAGTGNVGAAYDQDGNYLGGGTAPTRTVAPGLQVAVGLTGDQVFGSGTTGLLGTNGILAQIANDLQSGTSSSIANVEGSDLQALNTAVAQVSAQAAQMGANYQQVQAFATQATDTQQVLQTQMSQMDSTNVAQVTTQLTESQQAFEAALWATSQLSQDSLVQFLG